MKTLWNWSSWFKKDSDNFQQQNKLSIKRNKFQCLVFDLNHENIFTLLKPI